MIERLPFAAIILGISIGAASAGIPDTLMLKGYKRPEISAEIGIGVGSLVFGIVGGIESNLKAVELAEKGQTKRAYLETLKGTFQTATAIAVSATAFSAMIDKDMAVTCAIAGALVSAAAVLIINGLSVHKAIRQRGQIQNLPNSLLP